MDACQRRQSLIRCGPRVPRAYCAARSRGHGHRQSTGMPSTVGDRVGVPGEANRFPTDLPLLVGLTPVRLRNALSPRQICLEQTFKKFAMVGDFEMEQFVNNNELLEPIRLVKQV